MYKNKNKYYYNNCPCRVSGPEARNLRRQYYQPLHVYIYIYGNYEKIKIKIGMLVQ